MFFPIIPRGRGNGKRPRLAFFLPVVYHTDIDIERGGLFMAKQRHHWVGMRMIKTVIAVFICGIFGYVRGEPAFYSMIAAVICMQNSTDKTITSSVNRAIGTLVGGLYGIVILYGLEFFHAENLDLLRYTLVSLTIIPLIRTALLLKRPSSASLSCVVFLCVTVNHNTDSSPALFALQRMVDTLAGVAVTCVIDLVLPYHPKPEEQSTESVPATTDTTPKEPKS